MKQIFGRVKLLMASAALVAAPSLASASSNLESNDFVGISFWKPSGLKASGRHR